MSEGYSLDPAAEQLFDGVLDQAGAGLNLETRIEEVEHSRVPFHLPQQYALRERGCPAVECGCGFAPDSIQDACCYTLELVRLSPSHNRLLTKHLMTRKTA